jgi:preprotein translocase subunit SecD
MKKANLIRSAVIVVLLAVMSYFFFGGQISSSFNMKGYKDIRQGIDVKGGIYSLLYADGVTPTDDQLASAKSIIDKRLEGKLIFDASTTVDKSNKRISVEIPWKTGASAADIQATLDDIGKLALLTFREVDPAQKNAAGDYLPVGNIVINGSEVIDAKMAFNQSEGKNVVSLTLNAEGTARLAEVTGRLVASKGIIAIYLDDKQLMAPYVSAVITDGKAEISGNMTAKEAGELASLIKAGALPFKLISKQTSIISPTLGERALNVTVVAGIIAFFLICIFMIGFYRLPGVLSCIALYCLALIVVSFIAWTGIAITLPGIAGIILTLGMGVDANVIIYERIKEEMRSGKTTAASIDLGFKRAFNAIFDSNITTVIVAVVLFFLGSGAIKGFGITLFLGVVVSFFTAITVSRILIKSTLELGLKTTWWYGVKQIAIARGQKNV